MSPDVAFVRKMRGILTQKELAELLNVSESQIYRIQKGECDWLRKSKKKLNYVKVTKRTERASAKEKRTTCKCGGRLEFDTNGDGELVERCRRCA